MKNYNLLVLLLYIVWSISLVGCSDEKKKEDIAVAVTLSANKTTIKANGKDSLMFTVKVDGKETVSGVTVVPESSTQVNGLNKLKFSTSETGTYSFYALYNGHKSNPITITATKVVVKLTADKTTIKPNGTDAIKFTVKADDDEVTSSAVIMMKGEVETTLDKNVFSTENSGTYIFYATYDGEQSDKVTIRSSTETVILTLDKNEIKADGKETVSFTVKADGREVTNAAVLMQKSAPDDIVFDGKRFKTVEAGTYTFYAVYDSVKSKELTLKATYIPLKFRKQHCVMQFTSATCHSCPIMTQAIGETVKKYANRIVPVVFHLEKHCLNYPELYGVLGATTEMLNPIRKPSVALVDLHTKVNVYPTTTVNKLSDAIYHMATICPPQTGIALESKETDGIIRFTADIITNQTDRYGFYAFVVEDSIIYGQMKGPEEVDLKYVHNNIATYKLSDANPKTGIELGEIEAGKKSSRSYTIDTKVFKMKRNVKLKNCRIVAYTLRVVNGVYCIDNVASCPINGSVDY